MSTLSGYLYTCSAGETFDSIALAVYGHEKYAAELMNANPGYVLLTAFTGGEILSLPVMETDDSEDEPAPSTAPWK